MATCVNYPAREVRTPDVYKVTVLNASKLGPNQVLCPREVVRGMMTTVRTISIGAPNDFYCLSAERAAEWRAPETTDRITEMVACNRELVELDLAEIPSWPWSALKRLFGLVAVMPNLQRVRMPGILDTTVSKAEYHEFIVAYVGTIKTLRQLEIDIGRYAPEGAAHGESTTFDDETLKFETDDRIAAVLAAGKSPTLEELTCDAGPAISLNHSAAGRCGMDRGACVICPQLAARASARDIISREVTEVAGFTRCRVKLAADAHPSSLDATLASLRSRRNIVELVVRKVSGGSRGDEWRASGTNAALLELVRNNQGLTVVNFAGMPRWQWSELMQLLEAMRSCPTLWGATLPDVDESSVTKAEMRLALASYVQSQGEERAGRHHPGRLLALDFDIGRFDDTPADAVKYARDLRNLAPRWLGLKCRSGDVVYNISR